MKNPFSSMVHSSCLVSSLLFGSFLLLGCGTSPENRGKEMADLNCECGSKSDDLAYQKSKTLDEEVKSGLIKTTSQLLKRSEELQKPIFANERDCNAKRDALRQKTRIDFPKEDDQSTIANLASALQDQCYEEQKKKQKELRKTYTPIGLLERQLRSN